MKIRGWVRFEKKKKKLMKKNDGEYAFQKQKKYMTDANEIGWVHI